MLRLFPVVLVCAALGWGQGQLGTGAIAGSVEDPSGGAVPDAAVVISNTATGLVRRLATNEAGQFAAPVLPPGGYSVRIEKEGFSHLNQQNVSVSVGGTVTLNLRLKVGAVSQTVTVEDAPVIATTNTEETSLVSRGQINDLPINGRRADQFALLAAGVARDGRNGLLSYRGMSGVFNNFMLEGNDNNNSYWGESNGRSRIASNISSNAVQEFQVGKSNFLAEFGRAVGGSINSVVRSGGNDLHADGFYYFRNNRMGARDPLAKINPFEQRQQFGGSVGGPLKRDKLFFFVNYDQQLRKFPIIINDGYGALTNGKPSNPNSPTYTADLAAFNAGAAFMRGKFPGGEPGNTLPRTGNQFLGLMKTDWLINEANTLAVTFNKLYWYGERNIQSPLINNTNGNNGSDDVRIDSLNSRLTTIVSPGIVNEARGQLSRDWNFEFGDTPPPNISAGGFAYGRAVYLQRLAYPDERKLQLVDNLSSMFGSHSAKFGFDFIRSNDRIDTLGYFGGAYSYSTVLELGRDLLNPGARNYSSYTQNFGLSGTTFSVYDFAGFAQDQWRILPDLTVNYGLRYEFQKLPAPAYPNPAIPETQRIPGDKLAFGPRIGIAYDLFHTASTVLRGGYGMFYARTPNGMIFNALMQTGLADPARNMVSLTFTPADASGPVFPSILLTIPTGANIPVPALTRIGSDFRRPRAREINAGVEQRLSGNVSLSVSYIFTKGERLPLRFDDNLTYPQFERTYRLPDGSTFQVPFSAGMTRTATGIPVSANSSRPNPTLGPVSVTRSMGASWYNAMLVELRRRFDHGVQFQVSYTLAKSENLTGTGDGGGTGVEGAFGGGALYDQFDMANSRGISPMDQRHRLVANGVWQLKPRNRNALSRLMQGFTLSGIFSAESGRPYATLVSVPNIPFLAPDGAQYNGFGGLLGQGGISFLPTVVRNSVHGDANYRLDLRAQKDVFVTERLKLEFFVEGFNVFNRSNFNGYTTTKYFAASTTETTPLATPIPLTAAANYGVPTDDASAPDGTNARRVQVAFRFRF